MMSIRTESTEGTPSWVDVAATDPADAAELYEGLFGWTRTEMPTGAYRTDSMFHTGWRL